MDRHPSLPAAERRPGYRQEAYARSLREFGIPRKLDRAGGWLLERPIAGTLSRDGVGCYPMLACSDWSALSDEWPGLAEDLVSVSFVADPFGRFDPRGLEAQLDVFREFKQHFVLDLSLRPETAITKHHRYYARKARRDVLAEVTEHPSEEAVAWTGLYEHLIERHQIEGIRTFSESSFAEQLSLQGMIMVRALEDGNLVAAHLWLLQDDIAYSHLAASSPRGYELGASYALYDEAIRYFTGKAAWINFGGGAGLSSDADDGLTRFKKGWASGTRTAYFCGKILQQDTYEQLAHSDASPFFPAYRTSL